MTAVAFIPAAGPLTADDLAAVTAWVYGPGSHPHPIGLCPHGAPAGTPLTCLACAAVEHATQIGCADCARSHGDLNRCDRCTATGCECTVREVCGGDVACLDCAPSTTCGRRGCADCAA